MVAALSAQSSTSFRNLEAECGFAYLDARWLPGQHVCNVMENNNMNSAGSNENIAHAAGQDAVALASRKPWTKPHLSRLSAGAAELEVGNRDDGVDFQAS